MRASTLLTVILSAVAGTAAAGCSCKKVSNEGIYCGYCGEVTSYGDGGFFNAYWCNKKGGCTDMGYSKTYCDKSTKRYCDGRDKWKRDDEDEDVVEVKFEG